MTSAVRFRNHEEFHRTAAVMAATGAAGAALAHVFAGGALAGGGAAAVGVAVLAAAVVNAGGPRAWLRGYRAWRWLAALALAALGYGLARWTMGSIAYAQELHAVPGWASAALGGAAFALIAATVVAPRHVLIRRDRVGAAYGALRTDSDEISSLAKRGHELWRRADRELDPEDATREALEEAVLRLLDVAKHWRSVELERAPTAAADVVERMDELDARIAASDDEVVRRQYGQARAALAEQLRYLRGIDRRRDRAVALMHAYLATTEQLRLAVVNLESARVQPLLSDLDELARQVDAAADVDAC